MKQVSRDEYDEVLKNYPNKLEKDYSSLHMPPAIMYWDYSKENNRCIAKTYVDLEPETYKELGQVYFISEDMDTP